MIKANRLYLYISNIIVMISGFLLPVYITRILPNYSDSVFFYLSLLNPLIILFGLDQRKLIILGSNKLYGFHTGIRFNFIMFIIIISSVFLIGFNSLYFFPILFIKMISFSMDMHNAVLQNEKNFVRLFLLRIIELLLIVIMIFVDSSFNIILLLSYLFYLTYKWGKKFDLSIFKFIKTNYFLGLQGTLTAFSSALGIYILKLSGHSDLITELVVQTTILSAVYMAQSIYLNSILDEFKEIGNVKTTAKLLKVNIVFIIGGLLAFLMSHYFDLFKILYDYNLSFSFLSIYAYLFMIIHMMKNSQFIYSFLMKKQVIVSKYKMFMNLFYIFPLLLPINFELKFLIVLMISFGEFLLVFKFIKK
jgi:hypothetical protein